MLENTDTLLALAEIAAAFAGFAALVSVIRRGSNQPVDAAHDLLESRDDRRASRTASADNDEGGLGDTR